MGDSSSSLDMWMQIHDIHYPITLAKYLPSANDCNE
jgi:hypothetical protein